MSTHRIDIRKLGYGHRRIYTITYGKYSVRWNENQQIFQTCLFTYHVLSTSTGHLVCIPVLASRFVYVLGLNDESCYSDC